MAMFFHAMAKPAGPACNLRCEYCFYREKEALFEGRTAERMSDLVLERFIRSMIAAQPEGEIEFAWQGGEPTLMGLDFFRRAVALQKKFGQGRTIRNALQTNGVLLDDAWCAFLARERFLVGVSIDGPAEIHDRYRKHADGRGSFAEVMRAVEGMNRHGVEYNAMACVTRESAGHGAAVYRFFRDAGFRFIQFIPVVERPPGPEALRQGLTLDVPPDAAGEDRSAEVMPFTVEPAAFGRFLTDVFDRWVRRDVGRVFVHHFDGALAAWSGYPPAACVHARVCGNALALEHDGDVYACDHYVYPDYRRGNILTEDLADIVSNVRQRAFGMQKELGLTEECRACRFLRACNGGCPKHRFAPSSSGQPGHNYLCAGYRLFFEHVAPKMEIMAGLLREGRPAADIMKRFSRRPPPAAGKRVQCGKRR